MVGGGFGKVGWVVSVWVRSMGLSWAGFVELSSVGWVSESGVRGHHSMYMCVCVFFPSILDIKFVGRTSRGHTGGRSHRIFNPPSFCGACLDFCREKDSAIPFPRRP